MTTIPQNTLFYIKKLCFLFIFLLISCEFQEGTDIKGKLIFPSGRMADVRFAFSLKDQEKGLSGLAPKDFSDDLIMWFYYLEDDYKVFWMPNTYFDLDIIFVDKDLKILKVVKKMPSHPGYNEPPPIAKTPLVYARHVLEVKSSSPLAKEFKEGEILKWKGSYTLQQIESKIRRP